MTSSERSTIGELSDIHLEAVSGGKPAAKDPPVYLHFYFKLVAVKTVG